MNSLMQLKQQNVSYLYKNGTYEKAESAQYLMFQKK